MGTWDEGLLDNDQALDVLADLIESIPLDKDPAHLAAGLGLALWFQAELFTTELERCRRLLARRADWVRSFPPEVRAVLDEIAGDPAAASEAPGGRPAALLEILGPYCNGPRRTELLTVAGAGAVIAELAQRCRDQLTSALGRADDLYELAGELAPLGVLLELGGLAPRTPSQQITAWEAAFAAIDGRTLDERDFWNGYGARVRKGLALLRATP
jgi:hypothetical protein